MKAKGSLAMVFLFALMAIGVLFASGCHIREVINTNMATENRQKGLFEFASVTDQVTGIAVSSRGRIFVNFPRWIENPAQSVAEVMTDGSLRPYPNQQWNQWNGETATAANHFVCTQSVHIDKKDFLWILDPASPALKGVVPGGAKLVKIDLATDRIVQVISFDEETAPSASYLNDVRIDHLEQVAYITDSGLGAIVVVDLKSNLIRRLLTEHPSTKAEPSVALKVKGVELHDQSGRTPPIHADGIALDTNRKYLYYHALTGRTLYRIETRFLRDQSLLPDELGKQVEKLSATGPVDGMETDHRFNLYLTSPENSAIQRYRVYDRSMEKVAENSEIQWPDSLCLGPDDYLYLTDSQLNLMPLFNQGVDKRKPPYKLYKIWLTAF